MEHVVLREATHEDGLAIAALLRAAYEEYRGRLDPPSGSLDATVDKVNEKMVTARTTLALHRGAIVGCIFDELQGDYLYFFSLAVLPGYRKRGIGRTLIEAVERRARALSLAGVCLGVRLALPRLLDYYDHLGYCLREYRSHDGYREPTYAILEKEFRVLDADREM